MKTLIATLAATAAVTAAVPAMAQPYGHGPARYEAQRWDSQANVNQRQRELERIIEAAARRGDLTRREANELRNDMRSIARLEASYRSGGLNARERAELNRRLDWAERRLVSRLDNTAHRYGYGYGHRR